jgi:hypothetical protein
MDGKATQLAGDVLQWMERLRNLRELNCNGWRGYATSGECPAMDGKVTLLAGDKLQRMERLRNLRELNCNGWKGYATSGRYPATDGSFLPIGVYQM